MNPHPPLLQRIPKMLADQAYAPGRNVSPKSKERSLNAMADPVAAAALRDRDLLNVSGPCFLPINININISPLSLTHFQQI